MRLPMILSSSILFIYSFIHSGHRMKKKTIIILQDICGNVCGFTHTPNHMQTKIVLKETEQRSETIRLNIAAQLECTLYKIYFRFIRFFLDFFLCLMTRKLRLNLGYWISFLWRVWKRMEKKETFRGRNSVNSIWNLVSMDELYSIHHVVSILLCFLIFHWIEITFLKHPERKKCAARNKKVKKTFWSYFEWQTGIFTGCHCYLNLMTLFYLLSAMWSDAFLNVCKIDA